jgi:hypothetical protein
LLAYDQLVASGWKPNRKIVRSTLKDKGVPATHLDAMTQLVMAVAEGILEEE